MLWTLNSPDHCRRLVTSGARSNADYETWLAITTSRTLITTELRTWDFSNDRRSPQQDV